MIPPRRYPERSESKAEGFRCATFKLTPRDPSAYARDDEL